MTLVKNKDIETLVNVQNQNGLCLSIYIPTHRKGVEVLESQDTIMFKNMIRDAEELLSRHDMPAAEIKEFMKPAYDLLGDSNFWRHQGEGLAFFLAKGFSRFYTLPIPVKEKVYVLDQFYLTPLLPMLSRNGRFFVLHLYREKIMFYEATVERMRPIEISNFMPDTMNEALKFDLKGGDQDFTHSTTTVNGSNIVHGPGTNKSDGEHHRVREFLQEIDNGLQKILHDSHEPLVLAGVDHYCSIFRKVTSYKNVVEGNVNVDEGNGNIDTLHKKALQLIEPILRKEHNDWLDRYQNVVGTGKTSEDASEVASEAVHGRVDALFITPGNPIWGSYDELKAAAEIHDKYHRGDHDLINLAAVKTLTQGGRVFVSDYNGMAEATDNGQAQVRALFRF